MSMLLSHWVVALPVSDSACPTDWVAGASMMIRREVIDAVGFMDEEYFMYYEEVDFTRKARAAGWTGWYVPASHVVQLVGQASGVTDPRQRRRRRPAYWFESRRRCYMRNVGLVRFALADLAFVTGRLTWQARRMAQGRPDDTPDHLLRDLFRHSVFIGARQ
jgi:GT2 family glycosyltransferase